MKRLLFIDDDTDVRVAFADLLACAGWEVVHARQGEEALAWLAAHDAPAVIVLDLKMPVCDGHQFRRRQLADPRLVRIPVVVFTADSAATVDGDLFGAVPIVRKSQEFPELLAAVDRAAARCSAAAGG
jgi:CheY-like chemotaxis protein